MDNTILFFGYGANRSNERLKDIFGKELEGGYGTVLEGYVLAVQVLEQIPSQAKDILQKVWGQDFKSYTIKPGKGIVAGVVWELDNNQLEVLKEWEFIGIWRELIQVTVTTFDQKTLNVMTEKSPDESSITEIVDGLNYENNLNKQGKRIIEIEEYKIKEILKIKEELKNLQ